MNANPSRPIARLALALATLAALAACNRAPRGEFFRASDNPPAQARGPRAPSEAAPAVIAPVVVDASRSDAESDVAVVAPADVTTPGRRAAEAYIHRDTSSRPDETPGRVVADADASTSPSPSKATSTSASKHHRAPEPTARTVAHRVEPADPPTDMDTPTAVVRDPGSARALNQRGIALIRADRPADAVAVLQRAVALQPRDAELRGNLGYAYMLAGDYNRAQTQFTTALDLAPTRAATWLNLGQTYAELGRGDAAVDAVVRGYRYATNKPSVRSALRRAATGDGFSASWREASARALDRIDGGGTS